jgi:ATP-dependent protease ClpP protease subunit
MIPPRLNRAIWAGVLILLIIFALKAHRDLQLRFARAGTFAASVDSSCRELNLSWSGKINAPLADRISEAFDAHKNEVKTVVLSLDSPGGLVEYGATVIRLLKTISQTHSLETVVESGAMCASMCVPVYLAGSRRTAAAGAKFMFHDVKFRDFYAEQDTAVPEASVRAAMERFFARYFKSNRVSETWLRTIKDQIAGGQDIWKTGQELIDEKSGVVDELF